MDRLELVRRWTAGQLGQGDVPLEPASQDASFRRYFRVRTREGSFVVMDAPPAQEDSRPYVHAAQLLREAGVNVPRVLAADLDRGLLLLTDLGTVRYLDVLDESNAEALYGDATDALLRMQRGARTAGLAEYDAGRLRAEMALFPQWFLRRHLDLEITPQRQAALEECFALLCASAAEQPRVFVHRDYHSRNLMVVEGANPGVLDFQDAVRGPLSYDLLSLLRDVYVAWPPARVAGWADAYAGRALECGLLDAAGRGRFARWFDLMGVQRHLKVAGIFARLWYRDGKPGYLPDLPLTLEYLLASCARYPELAPLHRLLEALRVRERTRLRNAEVLAEARG